MEISKVDLKKLFQESGKKKIWVAEQLKKSPSYISIAIRNTPKRKYDPAIIKLRKQIYDLLTNDK